MNKCDSCRVRKNLAQRFDLHWHGEEDCPYDKCQITTNAELRPCPFCGGKAFLSRRKMRCIGWNDICQKKVQYGEQAICGTCHARGPLYSRVIIFPSEEHQAAFRWLEESASEAWNRRARDEVS